MEEFKLLNQATSVFFSQRKSKRHRMPLSFLQRQRFHSNNPDLTQKVLVVQQLCYGSPPLPRRELRPVVKPLLNSEVWSNVWSLTEGSCCFMLEIILMYHHLL